MFYPVNHNSPSASTLTLIDTPIFNRYNINHTHHTHEVFNIMRDMGNGIKVSCWSIGNTDYAVGCSQDKVKLEEVERQLQNEGYATLLEEVGNGIYCLDCERINVVND